MCEMRRSVSSDTRRPLPYNVSIMARLRTVSLLSAGRAAIIAQTRVNIADLHKLIHDRVSLSALLRKLR